MKYKLTDSQVSTSLSGQSVILNHRTGQYFNLNEVGSSIWAYLSESPRDLATLTNLISQEYNVTPETCQADIAELLNELVNEELVEEVA